MEDNRQGDALRLCSHSRSMYRGERLNVDGSSSTFEGIHLPLRLQLTLFEHEQLHKAKCVSSLQDEAVDRRCLWMCTKQFVISSSAVM